MGHEWGKFLNFFFHDSHIRGPNAHSDLKSNGIGKRKKMNNGATSVTYRIDLKFRNVFKHISTLNYLQSNITAIYIMTT